jgi:peptide/nickel transport system ATP-binding protein
MDKKELQTIRRKDVSMVFQDPTAALNPVFKIEKQLFDVIKYSRIAKGMSTSNDEMRNDAIDVLKKVALPDPERILDNYPFQLSGGMRQRICIAMALVSASELIIADEPGTSLDVTIEDQILRLLESLVIEKGVSIILVSHALGAVKRLVDRVYVMYAGTIVESAQTEELFSDPIHPYTRGLMNAIPKITGGGIPEAIGGNILSYLNPPVGCRFFPRCNLADASCKDKRPELLEISKDHKVACLRYER